MENGLESRWVPLGSRDLVVANFSMSPSSVAAQFHDFCPHLAIDSITGDSRDLDCARHMLGTFLGSVQSRPVQWNGQNFGAPHCCKCRRKN